LVGTLSSEGTAAKPPFKSLSRRCCFVRVHIMIQPHRSFAAFVHATRRGCARDERRHECQHGGGRGRWHGYEHRNGDGRRWRHCRAGRRGRGDCFEPRPRGLRLFGARHAPTRGSLARRARHPRRGAALFPRTEATAASFPRRDVNGIQRHSVVSEVRRAGSGRAQRG
jgi:hypothetical protein